MKKRFKYLAIRHVREEGAFGEYLQSPVNDKTRTAIIGERLSFLRAEAGLSQRDVCEIIGVAPTTYSGYELGQHEPTCETICRLAELYHISTDFIIGLGAKSVDPDREMADYIQHKAVQDFKMENVKQSMAKVIDEAEKLEATEK